MPQEDVGNEDQRPLMIENWQAAEARQEFRAGYECPLFGDAHIPGDITSGLGPYQVLNGLAGQNGFGVSRQVLVLRYGLYGNSTGLSLNQTRDGSYHGGTLVDEFAALLSVMLGVRLKAGSDNRVFFPGSDPKGSPYGFGTGNPVLLTISQKPIVPRVLETHELGEGELIKRLPTLAAKDSVALVRAARYFADGLWLAESDPALSWLLLVSAIETAAGRWREAQETPQEKLTLSKPDLVDHLLNIGGQELVDRIANDFAPYMGATKKFLDFILEFRPEPPPLRPLPSAYQVPWDATQFKRAIKRIYDYRSRALHGGKPFPRPMCIPPDAWGTPEIPHETIGHNVGVAGGTWIAQDLPMYLHTFVYIVQGTLINWWQTMLASANTEVVQADVEPETGGAEANLTIPDVPNQPASGSPPSSSPASSAPPPPQTPANPPPKPCTSADP